jgi:hypothetical protein
MSENGCIVTSMNLYEFSQVNNNEMGIYVDATEDSSLYRDAKDEVQRILRVSEMVRMSAERIEEPPVIAAPPAPPELPNQQYEKLTTSKLAMKLGLKTKELSDRLVAKGLLELKSDKPYLTDAGKKVGGEFRSSPKFGPYFIWPDDLVV